MNNYNILWNMLNPYVNLEYIIKLKLIELISSQMCNLFIIYNYLLHQYKRDSIINIEKSIYQT